MKALPKKRHITKIFITLHVFGGSFNIMTERSLCVDKEGGDKE